MVQIRNVAADVVQQRRVFEPFAGTVPQAMNAAALVEQRQRQPSDVLGVFGVPAAPLAELDHAAPPDVGISLDAGDLLVVPVDEIQNQAFAQREVGQRDLLGAEEPDHGIEQDRARHHEVGAARVEPRQPKTVPHVEADHLFADLVHRLGGDPGVVNGVAVEQAAPRDDDLSKAEAGPRRGNHPRESGRLHLPGERLEFRSDVLDDLPFVALRQGVGRHVPVGEPDDAQRKAAGEVRRGGRAEGHLHRPSADVHDDGGPVGGVHAVDGGLVNEPGLLDARDDARPDPGALGDGRQELAAIAGFAHAAGGRRQDLVHLPRLGELLEAAQRLDGRFHRRGRQHAPAKAAGAEPDHLFLPVHDLEGQVRLYLGHDHVDRIGADVDGGKAHG